MNNNNKKKTASFKTTLKDFKNFADEGIRFGFDNILEKILTGEYKLDQLIEENPYEIFEIQQLFIFLSKQSKQSKQQLLETIKIRKKQVEKNENN